MDLQWSFIQTLIRGHLNTRIRLTLCRIWTTGTPPTSADKCGLDALGIDQNFNGSIEATVESEDTLTIKHHVFNFETYPVALSRLHKDQNLTVVVRPSAEGSITLLVIGKQKGVVEMLEGCTDEIGSTFVGFDASVQGINVNKDKQLDLLPSPQKDSNLEFKLQR
ncbi:hypothetical protein SLEP1_g37744 [Rubroshorea leprosula]|uniref:Uncharacterized protein n=1 Tax=Rubroshorea leprosula TaxID=152421 RepID=A0AAV5KVZ1_9ROSI|nr:hypothetical protein SLEP1_g37744 [Rubroshorea leprosula]